MFASSSTLPVDLENAINEKLEEKQEQHVEQDNTPGDASAFRSYFRLFSLCSRRDYLLEFIAIIAALAAGAAIAMVNLVFGSFITSITRYGAGEISAAKFRSDASRNSTIVSHGIVRQLRIEYLRSALRQEVGFFDAGTAGSIAMQASANGHIILTGSGEKVGLVFNSLGAFFAAFILAFVTQWKLTLIISCIVPVLFVTMAVISGMEAKVETDILKQYSQAGSFAESALSTVRTVHAFGIRDRLVQKYTLYLAEALRLGKKKSIMYGGLFSMEYFLLYVGFALAFWQGIRMFVNGEIKSSGDIFTVLLSVTIGATSLTQIAPHLIAFTQAASAAKDLFNLIDRTSSIDAMSLSGSSPSSIEGAVELQHVNFEYPLRPGIHVLQDFNLKCPAGKMTALVGASGSGKSTIIGLLERWYNQTSGSITLDGNPIHDLNLNWLRRNIRLVQQEPVLFNDTVYENIVNGLVGTEYEHKSKNLVMDRVIEAATTAYAHDFIMQLPQGYETRIGERGGLLSGGQKQRIAIARSIISKPRVLLLDEATSALDPHSETIVQEALDRASVNRTTIVIAHKLSTVKAAHNIVVMGKGKIIEQGTHTELIALGGTYARLVRAQELLPLSNNGGINDDDTTDQDAESDNLTKNNTSAGLSLAKSVTQTSVHLAQDTVKYDYERQKSEGLMKIIRYLVKDTQELRTVYAVVLIACLIGGALFPGQALLLGNIVNVFQLSPDRMQSRGNFFALMFFVLALGCLFVYFAIGYFTNIIAQSMSYKYRRELLDRFLVQDIEFFDRPENTTGALASKLDTYPRSVLELMGFNIGLILIAVTNVVICSILALAYAWKLGLVLVLCGLPPLMMSGWYRIRQEVKMDKVISQRYSASSSVASESVAAIRTISSLAIEKSILKKYTTELDHAFDASVRSTCIFMTTYSLTQSVEFFFMALGFWYGCRLVSFNEITMFEFTVAFMGVYFAGQSAALMFTFSTSLTKARNAGNYIRWMHNLLPSIRERSESPKAQSIHDIASAELEKLSFHYPLRPDSKILRGVSLKIEKGQFVAFVGASGCGKSTMIAMLERYYDPTRGCININDVNLTDIDPVKYRESVALVQQEPTLYQGSIWDNICYGLPHGEATKEMVEEACRSANVWDFVGSLPEGLSTQVGNNGSHLSGGQKQRIAIARALIRKPQLLLLDEATSALDSESEKIVQDALATAAKSSSIITIAVAHRLSTIRDADKICVFQGGQIVECGTHRELLRRGPIYRAMCERQGLE